MRSRRLTPVLILSVLSVYGAACDESATSPLDGGPPDAVSGADSVPAPDTAQPDLTQDMAPADTGAADSAADVRLADAHPGDQRVTDAVKGDAYVGCPFNLGDPACNFKVTDCLGLKTEELFNYKNHSVYKRGVFVVRVPPDDTGWVLLSWLNSLVPQYQTQGIKFLFILGNNVGGNQDPADMIQCNLYGIVNLLNMGNLKPIYRDGTGNDSVCYALGCPVAWCFYGITGDMKNSSRVCYHAQYIDSESQKPWVEKMLNKLITTQP